MTSRGACPSTHHKEKEWEAGPRRSTTRTHSSSPWTSHVPAVFVFAGLCCSSRSARKYCGQLSTAYGPTFSILQPYKSGTVSLPVVRKNCGKTRPTTGKNVQ